MPKAVSVPSGEISVIRPPTPTPSRRARRSPTAISSSPNSASEPATIWLAISLRSRISSGRMPRTSAPEAPASAVAMTCPSISGVALTTPGTCRTRSAAVVETGQPRALAIDGEVSIEPEDAADQLGAEPVHHRHHDDQRRDPERDPEQREDRDDRDKPLGPPRPQIAERDHPLECVEDHGDICRTKAQAKFTLYSSWCIPG